MPFVCMRVCRALKGFRFNWHDCIRTQPRHIFMPFFGGGGSTSSCQSASHSTLIPRLVENTNACYLQGRFCVWEDCVAEQYVEHTHRRQKQRVQWRRVDDRHRPVLYQPIRVGFVLHFNGIGSTHLISHIISCVQMGSWKLNDMKELLS